MYHQDTITREEAQAYEDEEEGEGDCTDSAEEQDDLVSGIWLLL